MSGYVRLACYQCDDATRDSNEEISNRERLQSIVPFYMTKIAWENSPSQRTRVRFFGLLAVLFEETMTAQPTGEQFKECTRLQDCQICDISEHKYICSSLMKVNDKGLEDR